MVEHPSHNVSDSFWACYGCGVEAGDPRLEQPCPTPDAVGRSRMEHAAKKDKGEARRERLKHEGWIGVDLDGTLFHYETWLGWNVFGEPVMPMIRRVRQWLSEGRDVRIVTARVDLPLLATDRGKRVYINDSALEHTCRITGMRYSNLMMVSAIQDLTEKHVGARLPVQCYKDVHMIELWDDRAVQVVPNTGQTLAEAHEAELSALRGKVAQMPDAPL